MPELIWGSKLIFKDEKEYYETLGFLCKDEVVVRVYIEDNRKAGARGIQGRLRVVNGNYNFFPIPLKNLFESCVDKRPSLTEYVRNLQRNHCFTREEDPTGRDYTKWLYKTSLEEVQETVPENFQKDFLRGYLWNYHIDTRVLNREYLLQNAQKKNISGEKVSKDKILEKNDTIALKRDPQKKKREYDIFLSHSFMDQTLILSLVDLFTEADYAVYVDWLEDKDYGRNQVTPETARMLRERMNLSRGLAYVATQNAVSSKWCPWELGYFDGRKNSRCCILPIMEMGEYIGQEYLGLYPYLRYDKVSEEAKEDFLVYDPKTNKFITLEKWLDGQKIT